MPCEVCACGSALVGSCWANKTEAWCGGNENFGNLFFVKFFEVVDLVLDQRAFF